MVVWFAGSLIPNLVSLALILAEIYVFIHTDMAQLTWVMILRLSHLPLPFTYICANLVYPLEAGQHKDR